MPRHSHCYPVHFVLVWVSSNLHILNASPWYSFIHSGCIVLSQHKDCCYIFTCEIIININTYIHSIGMRCKWLVLCCQILHICVYKLYILVNQLPACYTYHHTKSKYPTSVYHITCFYFLFFFFPMHVKVWGYIISISWCDTNTQTLCVSNPTQHVVGPKPPQYS